MNGETLWSRDIAVNHLPNLGYWMHRVAGGELPHWNPYSGGGMPYAADPVQGTFYPPKLLILATSDPVTAYNWIIALHMLVAALGLERLLRGAGLGAFGALAGALIFLFSGPMAADTRQTQFMFALAWMPWMLDAARCHLAAGDCLSGPLLSVYGGLILLAGEPQTFLVAWGTVLLYWFCTPAPIEPGSPRKTLATSIGSAALWGSLGIGLSLIQWVPAWIIAQESSRATAGLGYAAAAECSFHPVRLMELFLPQVFGSDIREMTAWSPKFSCSEQMPVFYFHSLYTGIATLALLPLVFVKTRDARPVAVLKTLALWLTGLSLVISMGPSSPIDLYRILYDWLPSWNRLRFPERLLPWTALGLSVLAAIAANRWETSLRLRDRRRWYPAVAAAILLAIIVLPPWTAIFSKLDPRAFTWAEPVILHAARDGLAAALLSLAVFVITALRWPGTAGLLLPVLLFMDAGKQAGRTMDFWPDPAFIRTEPELASHLRILNSSGPAPLRYGPPGVLVTPANQYRVADPVTLAAAKNAALAIDQGILYQVSATATGNTLKSARLELAEHFLDPVLYERLHGASVIVADRQFPLESKQFHAVHETPQVTVYRNGGNSSRVICPSWWDSLPDNEGTVRFMATPASQFDPDTMAVGPFASAGTRDTPAVTCRLVSWSEERYEIEVTQTDDAPVVLRELFTSGWTARLENVRPLDILPANHLHQAVVAGPGKHRIIFEYRTPGLLAGAAGTLLSLVLLGLLAVRPRQTH
ncbi:MAG: hypothetical protein KIT79_11215 [Deltaproteobacteria bacterium]|nr:hypothetical protein [Deltaproteobacteria bacterium]